MTFDMAFNICKRNQYSDTVSVKSSQETLNNRDTIVKRKLKFEEIIIFLKDSLLPQPPFPHSRAIYISLQLSHRQSG